MAEISPSAGTKSDSAHNSGGGDGRSSEGGTRLVGDAGNFAAPATEAGWMSWIPFVPVARPLPSTTRAMPVVAEAPPATCAWIAAHGAGQALDDGGSDDEGVGAAAVAGKAAVVR